MSDDDTFYVDDWATAINHRFAYPPIPVLPGLKLLWRLAKPVLRIDSRPLVDGNDDAPFEATLIFPRRWHARLWSWLAPGIVLTGSHRRTGEDWRDSETPLEVTWQR